MGVQREKHSALFSQQNSFLFVINSKKFARAAMAQRRGPALSCFVLAGIISRQVDLWLQSFG
jgi:hypothetical protein